MAQTIATEEVFKQTFNQAVLFSLWSLPLLRIDRKEKKLTRRLGNDTDFCRTSLKTQITWLWPGLPMLLWLPMVSLISPVVILGMLLGKSLTVGWTTWWTFMVGITLAAAWNCLLQRRHNGKQAYSNYSPLRQIPTWHLHYQSLHEYHCMT